MYPRAPVVRLVIFFMAPLRGNYWSCKIKKSEHFWKLADLWCFSVLRQIDRDKRNKNLKPSYLSQIFICFFLLKKSTFRKWFCIFWGTTFWWTEMWIRHKKISTFLAKSFLYRCIWKVKHISVALNIQCMWFAKQWVPSHKGLKLG